MGRRRLPLGGVLFAAVSVCLGAVGCVSRGSLDIAELNFKRIPAEGPLTEHLVVENGYWWWEGDRLCVVLGAEDSGLSKATRKCLDLSFVLPGRPASAALDYRLDSRSVRAIRQVGADHARYRSTQGIAAVWFEPGGGLRGRYRFVAVKEIFHILTGWSRVGRVLCSGEFVARPDAVRGRKIFDRSQRGMNRADQGNTSRDGRPVPVRVEGPPVGQAPPGD